MILEITVVMALDRESEEALENAKIASRILFEKYMIKSIVVPINTWIVDPIKISSKGLPLILINGQRAFMGRAPTPNEIVEYVLKHFKIPIEPTLDAVPAALMQEDIVGDASLV